MAKINKKQLDKGAKIELSEHPGLKKYLKKGVSLKTVARSIAREHIILDPKSYKKESLPKK